MEQKNFQAAASCSLIIAPAVGTFPDGGQVSFLFSISQVEDILGSIDFSTVPFSPLYIDGIFDWRGHALPILSLETLIGIADEDISYNGNRAIVVKKTGSTHEPENWKRALIRIAPGCRMESKIPETEPLHAADYLPAEILPAVKGIYRWEGGLMIVPHIDHILSGEMNSVFSDDA